MKLKRVHVSNFQSVQDSTAFEIEDVTCLVGKNEAGKTALLKALYRLNPVLEDDGAFDTTEDYPRRAVSDYNDEVEAGRIEPAQVIEATFTLEAEDVGAVNEAFGSNCLLGEHPSVTISKGYANDVLLNDLQIDNKNFLSNLINEADLSQTLAGQLLEVNSIEEMLQRLNAHVENESAQELLEKLEAISEMVFLSLCMNQFFAIESLSSYTLMNTTR